MSLSNFKLLTLSERAEFVLRSYAPHYTNSNKYNKYNNVSSTNHINFASLNNDVFCVRSKVFESVFRYCVEN